MIIKEKGTIIKIEPDKITIEIPKGSGCQKCGCCSPNGKNRKVLAMPADGVNIGDIVEFEIDSAGFMKAGFLLFFVPTLGFFSGVVSVNLFFKKPLDIYYFSGGLIGVVLAFLAVKLFCGTKPKPAAVIVSK